MADTSLTELAAPAGLKDQERGCIACASGSSLSRLMNVRHQDNLLAGNEFTEAKANHSQPLQTQDDQNT